MDKLIRMSRIRKTYDGKTNVLDNLEFSICKGEISIVIGASGCGKSTFLNIVGLLDSFSSGEYFFNGTGIKRSKLNSYYQQRAKDIGFVFQAYCLIDSISVKENILMPFLYNNIRIDRSILNSMDSILKEFNIAHLKDKNSAFLSGGERQRVAIARAMVKNPKLIIADEPTGNLDDANAQIVVNAFQNIANHGTAIIVVTHNKQLSFESCKTYALDGGSLSLC